MREEKNLDELIRKIAKTSIEQLSGKKTDYEENEELTNKSNSDYKEKETKIEQKEVQSLNKSIDDKNKYSEETRENVEKAFEHYDKCSDEDTQSYLFNNIFAPAQDLLYKVMIDNFKQIFANNDESKLKKKEIKKVVVEGLKEYFKIARPKINEIIREIKDEEEQYDILTQYYDSELTISGQENEQDKQSLKKIIDTALKDKNYNIGKLKRDLITKKEVYTEILQKNYTKKEAEKLLRNIHPLLIMDYLKEELDKQGMYIHNATKFYTQNLDELIEIRNTIILKKDLEKHGLDYKPKEEKK
ncbi:MAG: hypothetical protein KKA51_01230 [Nanoarchaeota archaeon]|nr:hypothetical protein [Nanoarchaeota archaeon]MBU1270058.1 hypothetical protein [Nanoarchaeota archaeon]MBU2443794.1 hypothetical protein [Nanoarchaeota archaeon]